MPAQLLKGHPMKRGRPKLKKRHSTSGKHVYVMDLTTFVKIPAEYKKWIREGYTSGTLGKPPFVADTDTNIFYRSLAQKDIVTIEKWMEFLDTDGVSLLNTNIDEGLEKLGLYQDEITIASRLSDYEAQRWYEMYYVKMIRERGRCGLNLFPCYDPDIANQIAAKYGLVDTPCEPMAMLSISGESTDPLLTFPREPVKAKRRTGILPGGKTKIDFEEIEKLRISLMKCKSPIAIAKELDAASSTVYASMNDNMFEGRYKLNKTIDFHVETLKRLIPKGDVTFEKYVKTYAICETALIKALYKADPIFVRNWDITPTESSFEYEYVKHKSSKLKLSQAFGVPETLISKWLAKYALGKVVPPKAQTKIAGAKSLRKGSDLTYDEHLARLGIDPNYDPLASEREKWNRDYQTG